MTFDNNLKNIGIFTDINKEIDKAMNLADKNKNVEVSEEISLNNLQQGKIVLEPIEYQPKKLKLTPDEKLVIEKLEKKYKGNFKKMFKDIKVNKFQWNESQIEKIHQKYLKLYGTF